MPKDMEEKKDKRYDLEEDEVVTASTIKKSAEQSKKKRRLLIIAVLVVAILFSSSLIVRNIFFQEEEVIAFQFAIETTSDHSDELSPDYPLDSNDPEGSARRDAVTIGDEFRLGFEFTNTDLDESSVPLFLSYEISVDVPELGSNGNNMPDLIGIEMECDEWVYNSNLDVRFYRGILEVGEKMDLTFLMSILSPNTIDINDLQGKTMEVNLKVDIIEADMGAVNQWWGAGNVPQEWYDEMDELLNGEQENGDSEENGESGD